MADRGAQRGSLDLLLGQAADSVAAPWWGGCSGYHGSPWFPRGRSRRRPPQPRTARWSRTSSRGDSEVLVIVVRLGSALGALHWRWHSNAASANEVG